MNKSEKDLLRRVMRRSARNPVLDGEHGVPLDKEKVREWGAAQTLEGISLIQIVGEGRFPLAYPSREVIANCSAMVDLLD